MGKWAQSIWRRRGDETESDRESDFGPDPESDLESDQEPDLESDQSLLRSAESAASPAAPGLPQVVIVAVLLPGLLASFALLANALHSSERYKVDLSAVTWNGPPSSEASALTSASLATQPLHDLQRSIFDSDLGFLTRQEFESNPWVRRVVSVRRIFPRGLDIQLEYRLPFATVVRDGVYLVADGDGELLPIAADEPMLPFPIIQLRSSDVGVTDQEPYRETWFRAAIREGVAVLHDILRKQDHEVFGRVGVLAIDVSNFQNRLSDEKSEVVLVTNRVWSDVGLNIEDHKVLVSWGRSTQHQYEKAEIAVETKLNNLLGMLNLRPDLQGVDLIDVRFETPFWRPYRRLIVQGE